MKTWSDLPFWKSSRWTDELRWCLLTDDYYPVRENVFKALHLTPLRSVKAVIVGQDPYHDGNATGLAFSCNKPASEVNSSLRNIFAEYVTDTGHPLPQSGNLVAWAKRGVLLINNVWTVKPGEANSHAKWGWQELTLDVLKAVKEVNPNAVFVGWGKEAQGTINQLTSIRRVFSSHPSGMSFMRGFQGSRPFSKVNALLINSQQKPINWRLP